MFCKFCGHTDIPAVQMYLSDVCTDCAAIHDVQGKSHPDSDTAKLVEAAKQKAEEKKNAKHPN